MIKTLPQIIATFLAIGLTFVATYLIYLYSQQANIDIYIQDEAYKITTFYDTIGPTYRFKDYLFSPLPNVIRRTYLESNPNASSIDILDSFYHDLENIEFCLEGGCDKEMERIGKWLKNNRIPYAPAYMFICEESLKLMFPSSQTENEKSLFPYGPSKLDNWLELAERVKRFTKTYGNPPNVREPWINGFRKYIEVKNGRNKIFNYYSDAWFENFNMQLKNIFKSVDKIKVLRRLRKINNINERLPNLKWVGLFFFLTLEIGILIPLFIDSAAANAKVPYVVKLILLFTTVLFFLGSCLLLYKDITPKKDGLVSADNFNELNKFLDGLEDDIERRTFIDFIEINQALNLYNSDEIFKGVQKKLEELRADIIETNQKTPYICDAIGKRVASNKTINKHKATIGKGKSNASSSLNIVKWLMNENIYEYFKAGSDSYTSFYTQRVGEPSKDYLTIKMPKTENEIQKIVDELKKIRKKIIQEQDIEFFEWKNKRENIKKSAKAILKTLKAL